MRTSQHCLEARVLNILFPFYYIKKSINKFKSSGSRWLSCTPRTALSEGEGFEYPLSSFYSTKKKSDEWWYVRGDSSPLMDLSHSSTLSSHSFSYFPFKIISSSFKESLAQTVVCVRSDS